MRPSLPHALVAAALAAGLTGCAAPPHPAPVAADAVVTVRVAPRADPAAVEVQLAQPRGGFRAVHRLRAGETRRFAVPTGWLTVRVPGLCVVPAASSSAPTVEIGPDDCRLA